MVQQWCLSSVVCESQTTDDRHHCCTISLTGTRHRLWRLVHRTQTVKLFGNILHDFVQASGEYRANFHEDRPKGTPPPRALNTRVVSETGQSGRFVDGVTILRLPAKMGSLNGVTVILLSRLPHASIAIQHHPYRQLLKRLHRRPPNHTPDVFLKDTAFQPFYHLNYCCYVAFSSLLLLVVPFANFGCAWYFRTWNL